jgi:eukaryotic-like serine/threonine-protein kinase
MSDTPPIIEPPATPAPVPDQTIAFTDPAAAKAKGGSGSFDVDPALWAPEPEAPTNAPPADPDATTEYKVYVAQEKKPGKEILILGGYEVLEKIGHGGMGAVFRAKQVDTGKEVALKVLTRNLGDNKTYVARFYREAEVMNQLEHPHIIHCFGVGESHGLHYLAMELVEGGTLQQNIDRIGKFPLGDALHVTLACAYALEHAHERNLIHRDIKPENVLISKKGVVKLADLGLAKPMDDDMALTRSGVGAGTPQFMAPEQMRNARDVNGQADIYALGCMLYYMAAGVKPFKADSLMHLIELKEATKFTPLHEHCPQSPPALQRIIQRMLVKSLSTRYASISTVIEDLQALGLANARLSFFGTEATALPKSARMKVTDGPVVPGQSGKFKAPNLSGKFTVPTGEVWFVSQSRVEGKRRVKKMIAAQIIEQLQQKQLDPDTEISREANGEYAPAHTIPEFADYCPRPNPRPHPKPVPAAPKATLTPHRQPTQISHWEEPSQSFSHLYGGLVIGGVLALVLLVILMIVFIK